MAYDLIGFDFDGVLLDLPNQPFPQHMENVATEALRRYGVDTSHEVYDDLSEAITAHDTDALVANAAKYGIDHRDLWHVKEDVSVELQKQHVEAGLRGAYSEEEERIAREFFEDIAVLSDLSDHCEMVAFSNNNHDFIDYAMNVQAPQLNGVGSLDQIIPRYQGIPSALENNEHRKPSPYYLEKLAKEMGANSMLYVGDSNADVEAAYHADNDPDINVSVDSAFIWRPHRLDDTGGRAYELNGYNPTYHIDGLDELVDIVKNGHA